MSRILLVITVIKIINKYAGIFFIFRAAKAPEKTPVTESKNILSIIETTIYIKYCIVNEPSEIANIEFIKINTKVSIAAIVHNNEILFLIILIAPLGVVLIHSISKFDFNL